MYRKPMHVAHMLDGDRAVLMHLDSGVSVALSREATSIWQLVVEHGTAAAVVAGLSERYAVDQAVLANDVERILDVLVSADLLEVLS
ncbi:MAG TPA: PqqD family protein [Mycobacteriales bacterium]|nr:PqqD family protein [Mycobacteriales bacterium]